MRIILLVLASSLSLFAQGIFVDAVSSVHSLYLRNGDVMGREKPGLSQSLILDTETGPVWADLWFYSEMSGIPYNEAEATLHYDRDLWKESFLSLGLRGRSCRWTSPAAELEMSLETRLLRPVTGKIIADPVRKDVYASVDTWVGYDPGLPIYMSFKYGLRMPENTWDAELALSSGLSVGSYSLEPYITLSYPRNDTRLRAALNLSFTWELVSQ